MMLIGSASLFAEEHPYFEPDSWRKAFNQRGGAPSLIGASSMATLVQLDQDVEAIDLRFEPTDEVWAQLKKFPRLEELSVLWTYSPSHIAHFKEMARLERLSISLRGPVSADDLAGLGTLSLAGFLYITCTGESDLNRVGAALPVCEFPLRMLVSGSGDDTPRVLAGEDVLSLAGQPKLEWLHLNHRSLSPDAGKSIAQLPALRYLFVRGCEGFDTAFCEAISQSSSLEAIGGEGQAFDSDGLAALLAAKELSHLMLDNKLELPPQKVAEALRKARSLESLVLYNRKSVDTSVVHAIAGMKRLKWLELGIPKTVPDATIKRLSGLRGLTGLGLSSEVRRDPAMFDILAGMKKLDMLRWGLTQAPPPDAFRQLLSLKDLRRVELYVYALTGEHVKVLADLPQLAALDISNAKELTANDLGPLLAAKKLRRLRAHWPEGVKEVFAERRPEVELVDA